MSEKKVEMSKTMKEKPPPKQFTKTPINGTKKTVLVSSHILQEIERITEQIVILHNGKLLAIGNLHAIRDLLDNHPHRILIKCENPRSLAAQFIERLSLIHI